MGVSSDESDDQDEHGEEVMEFLLLTVLVGETVCFRCADIGMIVGSGGGNRR